MNQGTKDQITAQIEALTKQIAALQANTVPPPKQGAVKPRAQVERDYWAQFDWEHLSDTKIAELSGSSQPTVGKLRKKHGFPKSPGSMPSVKSVLDKFTPEQLAAKPVEYWAKETGLKRGSVLFYAARRGILILPEKKLARLQRSVSTVPVTSAPEPGLPRALHNCREAIRRMRGILAAAYNTPGAVDDGAVTVTEAEVESWMQDTRVLVEGGQQS